MPIEPYVGVVFSSLGLLSLDRYHFNVLRILKGTLTFPSNLVLQYHMLVWQVPLGAPSISSSTAVRHEFQANQQALDELYELTNHRLSSPTVTIDSLYEYANPTCLYVHCTEVSSS